MAVTCRARLSPDNSGIHGTTFLESNLASDNVRETELQTAHFQIVHRNTAMASRRLALNLSQGLRGRAALSAPLRRGFATPVAAPVKTETTTLKNGLTVSSQRGTIGPRSVR